MWTSSVRSGVVDDAGDLDPLDLGENLAPLRLVGGVDGDVAHDVVPVH
jgi:hypothetical protein